MICTGDLRGLGSAELREEIAPEVTGTLFRFRSVRNVSRAIRFPTSVDSGSLDGQRCAPSTKSRLSIGARTVAACSWFRNPMLRSDSPQRIVLSVGFH